MRGGLVGGGGGFCGDAMPSKLGDGNRRRVL